jgi:RimJ/RimL family protein N-acetyltransferase
MPWFVAPEELRFDDILVRSWRPGDGPALAAAVRESYPHLIRWMPWPKVDLSDAEAENTCRMNRGRWLKNEDFVLSVWEGNVVVGGSGFHLRRGPLSDGVAEIGMWIASSHAGTGLGTRLLRELVGWGFGPWGFERLEWRCDPENIGSWRVAEKAGLSLEGVLRSQAVTSAGRRDTRVYAATKT